MTLSLPVLATLDATSLPGTVVHRHDPAEDAWWRQAVTYQIYPRSFADSTGNGIGDLPGARAKLPYLVELGVDAVWFSPFYLSPQADGGYDVADYRAVDPLFGSLADFEGLLADATALGLKVIIDLVPNHTSDEHPWFQAALAGGPGCPERERYLFRDGLGAGGELPPNNWLSVFGGRGWTRVTEPDGTPGQWYLHLFDVKQPDLNWQHPQVRAEFLDIIDFWIRRGVAGFRVDVAHGLVKNPALPDWDGPQELLGPDDKQPTNAAPMWDQDGVHEIYSAWRARLDGYGEPDRIICAEGWVDPPERAVRYIRRDEFHQAFNFDFLECPWRAADLREVVKKSWSMCDFVGAPTTWVLNNHDVVRSVSRLGLPIGEGRPNGIGSDDTQPDVVLGRRRARAATVLMLGLAGAAYLYQGEELGLPEVTDVPDELREDPVFLRTDKREIGRDGCRVPLPWVHDAPGLGFGPTEATWLPQPAEFAKLAVDVQQGAAGSTLELYRTLLRLRRERQLGLGSLAEVDGLGEHVVAYLNSGKDGAHPTLIVLNLGHEPVELPAVGSVLVSSDAVAGTTLPGDTAAWLTVG
ncbi:MAG: glycoside hydrolase family 13 protein [Tetrasphaera sp.]